MQVTTPRLYAMFNYVMSPSGQLLHESDKPVKMICGPYGSGKSCACAVDVLSYACAQAPAPDGVRYTRVGIIRSTYNELLTTTRKSLLEVFPPECGNITGGGFSPRGFYIIPLPDGTKAQVELNFISLASVDDCEKVRSMNWTFAWVNEATGVPAEVFTVIQQRVGRFPSQDLGGPSWGGVILDFNMPPAGSWLHALMRNPPDNYLLIMQPPAAFERIDENGRVTYEINDGAENLRNLGAFEEGDPTEFTDDVDYEAYLHERGKRYYRNQIDSLLRLGRNDIIKNQYCMLDIPIVDGKPVYSNFNYDRHVAPAPLEAIDGQTVIIGSDTSGIHPAAVLMQFQKGQWCVLDEIYAKGEGLEVFLNSMLLPLLRDRYSHCEVIAALDPANARDSWTGITPSQRFAELGIQTVTEFSNSSRIRIEVVEHMFNMYSGGILISPNCELLIRGCQSEYRYRRIKASGTIGAVYTPQPEKNDASHICDALQYACLYIKSVGEEDPQLESFKASLSERRARMRKVL